MPGAAVLGTRLPGCFDPFETAVRAVLGQQITVAAANKLAARIAKTHGTPTGFGDDRLSRFFPTAAEVLSLDPVEDALGTLGVIKTRSRTIAEIARRVGYRKPGAFTEMFRRRTGALPSEARSPRGERPARPRPYTG